MNFLKDYFKGMAIGAGAILPGISSGVLCVIFGIYEKLIDSILGIFKNFKENLKFLFPIILGGVFGVLVFGNILNYLLYSFPVQTKSIFIGLILGTIPSLFKEIHSKITFKLHYIIFLILALVIGILTVYFEKNLTTNSLLYFDYPYLIFSGFAMSIGIIVPGVSSTIILMLLGVYSTYLSSVSYLYFPVLIPIGIGLIIGGIIWICITKFLLNNYYGPSFYSIIGFTLGSIIILYPSMNSVLEIIISILCISIGFIISSSFKTKKV